MTLAALLARLATALDKADIPYMVAGSVASSFHGEPRSTLDIDIIVDPSLEALQRFLAQLPSDEVYVDQDVALDALRQRTQFNVIDQATGLKADLVIRKERPFSEVEMQRRQPAVLLGTPSFIATAEDTIIAKLEWAQASSSDRQLRDATSIVAVSGPLLDRDYIEHWVRELGLGDLWSHIREL